MADTEPDRYPDSEGPFAGPNNTFPLNTPGRIKNAWARIHQGPTKANHSDSEIASIKGKIRAAAKEHGITLEEHDEPAAARALVDFGMEQRSVLMPVGMFETRAADGEAQGSRIIGGYAAVFHRESRQIPRVIGGNFVEIIANPFFEEARTAGWPGHQGSGVLCRWNHADQYLLGTSKAGTLQLGVDRTGLEYRVHVPQHRGDVLELTERRDIQRSSFTFMNATDDWSYTGDGMTQRTLLSGEVIDVAPCSAVVAYEGTTAALRSLARHMDAPFEDVEALANQHELRRLFIRTDGPPPAPATPVPAGLTPDDEEPRQLRLDEGDVDAPPPAAEPEAPTMRPSAARLRLLELKNPPAEATV